MLVQKSAVSGSPVLAKKAHVLLHDGFLTELSLVFDTHAPRNPDARVLAVKAAQNPTLGARVADAFGIKPLETSVAKKAVAQVAKAEEIAAEIVQRDEARKGYLVSIDVPDDIDNDGDGAEDYETCARLIQQAYSDLSSAWGIYSDSARAALVVAVVKSFREAWASVYAGTDDEFVTLKAAAKAGKKVSAKDKARYLELRAEMDALLEIASDPQIAADAAASGAAKADVLGETVDGRAAVIPGAETVAVIPAQPTGGAPVLGATEAVQPATAQIPVAPIVPPVTVADAPKVMVRPDGLVATSPAPATPTVPAAATTVEVASPTLEDITKAVLAAMQPTLDAMQAHVDSTVASLSSSVTAQVTKAEAIATGATSKLEASVQALTAKAQAPTVAGGLPVQHIEGGSTPPAGIATEKAGAEVKPPTWAMETELGKALHGILDDQRRDGLAPV